VKLLLKVPLSPYSGYGNDGLGMIKSLMAQGHDVYVLPAGVQPPIPQAIAQLLTRELKAPFDRTIVHVDPAQLTLSESEKRASGATIAWTMWEYSTLSNMKGRSEVKENLKHFDYFVGYDEVTLGAYEPRLPRGIISKVVQGGYDPTDWPDLSDKRNWAEGPFRFLMVGQLHERKDPFVAIQAFQELKDEYGPDFEDAELHLKTTIKTLHPGIEDAIPKLKIHYDVWDHDLMLKLYAGCHVLLAPSRGEGKNLPALEFMTTGGTVIATNWGGHTGWLTDEIGYKLDYVLRPVNPRGDALNARASKEHLKELMWRTFTNRAEARKKALAATSVIPAMCSWDAVTQRLLDATPILRA